MAQAKRISFPTRRSAAPKKRRRTVSPGTFIARSRAESSEQKAIWHNVTGAGRAHVKRVFLDLNEADTVALRDGLEKLMGARLKARERGSA